MKKFTFLIFFICLIYNQNYAQTSDNSDFDCEYFLKNTARFLETKDTLSIQYVEEINKRIKNCDCDNGDYNFIKGKILLLENKNLGDAFKFLKKSAELGNSESMYLLGVIFKDGLGLNQDYNSALNWFSKSAFLQNEKSLYALGYFNLKGLGGVQQNYDIAIKYFTESSYSMAKHWLALCYLHGYGVKSNKTLALDLFEANEIYNSSYVIKKPEPKALLDSTLTKNNYHLDSSKQALNNNTSLGSYYGSYVEFDWSGKKIQRLEPIKLEFNNEAEGNQYKIELGDNNYDGNFEILKSKTKFENLNIELPGLHIDHPSNEKLKYNIHNFNLSNNSIKLGNDNYHFSGYFDGLIENWNEPLPPHIILLNYTPYDDISIIDYEDLKIYPNPFQRSFNFLFELTSDAFVVVNIYNSVGFPVKTKIINDKLKKGIHEYEVNLNNQIPGNYIIEIKAGNETLSKIIVKK